MNFSLCLPLLCVISRLSIFADRWADDCYSPTSPSTQKQALREQPEELHRGRGVTADVGATESLLLMGMQHWISQEF